LIGGIEWPPPFKPSEPHTLTKGSAVYKVELLG
jgi:hypothetical protein